MELTPVTLLQKKQLDSSGDVTKNIDLKNQFNILNNLTRTFDQLKADDESLVSFEEVKEKFVGIQESEPMKIHLDMGDNFIYNVKTPTNNDQAANKSYVDKEINCSKHDIRNKNGIRQLLEKRWNNSNNWKCRYG